MSDQPTPPPGGPPQGQPPSGPPPGREAWPAHTGAPHGGEEGIRPGQQDAGQVEVPLHPLLPGSGPSRPSSAHHQPHAASAGPADGARGAMWFALGVAVLVLLCLVGLVAILS